MVLSWMWVERTTRVAAHERRCRGIDPAPQRRSSHTEHATATDELWLNAGHTMDARGTFSLNALSIPEVGPLLKSSGYHQHNGCWPARHRGLLREAPFRWSLDSATRMLPLPAATSNATLDDLEPFKNRFDSSDLLLGCLLGGHVLLRDIGLRLAPYLLRQYGRISCVVVHPRGNGGFNETGVDRDRPVRVGGICQ